jgi:hypothetical protein
MAEKLIFDYGKEGFVDAVPDFAPTFPDEQKEAIANMLEASRQYKKARGEDPLVTEENYADYIETLQTTGQNMLRNSGLVIPNAQLVALLSESDLPVEALQELLAEQGLLYNSAQKEAKWIGDNIPKRQRLTTGVAALLSAEPLMLSQPWSAMERKTELLNNQVAKRGLARIISLGLVGEESSFYQSSAVRSGLRGKAAYGPEKTVYGYVVGVDGWVTQGQMRARGWYGDELSDIGSFPAVVENPGA